jgi:hypothetical protein
LSSLRRRVVDDDVHASVVKIDARVRERPFLFVLPGVVLEPKRVEIPSDLGVLCQHL